MRSKLLLLIGLLVATVCQAQPVLPYTPWSWQWMTNTTDETAQLYLGVKVATVAEMEAYNGASTSIWLTDPSEGGGFVYVATNHVRRFDPVSGGAGYQVRPTGVEVADQGASYGALCFPLSLEVIALGTATYTNGPGEMIVTNRVASITTNMAVTITQSGGHPVTVTPLNGSNLQYTNTSSDTTLFHYIIQGATASGAYARINKYFSQGEIAATNSFGGTNLPVTLILRDGLLSDIQFTNNTEQTYWCTNDDNLSYVSAADNIGANRVVYPVTDLGGAGTGGMARFTSYGALRTVNVGTGTAVSDAVVMITGINSSGVVTRAEWVSDPGSYSVLPGTPGRYSNTGVSLLDEGPETSVASGNLTAYGQGGITYPATGKGSGWWVRQFSGSVNPMWFGATPDDDTNDDAASIAAALESSNDIEFTPGEYQILQPASDFSLGWSAIFAMTNRSDVTIRGNGALLNVRQRLYPAAFDYQTLVFKLNYCTNISITGLNFDSDYRTNRWFDENSGPVCVFTENVRNLILQSRMSYVYKGLMAGYWKRPLLSKDSYGIKMDLDCYQVKYPTAIEDQKDVTGTLKAEYVHRNLYLAGTIGADIRTSTKNWNAPIANLITASYSITTNSYTTNLVGCKDVKLDAIELGSNDYFFTIGDTYNFLGAINFIFDSPSGMTNYSFDNIDYRFQIPPNGNAMRQVGAWSQVCTSHLNAYKVNNLRIQGTVDRTGMSAVKASPVILMNSAGLTHIKWSNVDIGPVTIVGDTFSWVPSHVNMMGAVGPSRVHDWQGESGVYYVGSTTGTIPHIAERVKSSGFGPTNTTYVVDIDGSSRHGSYHNVTNKTTMTTAPSWTVTGASVGVGTNAPKAALHAVGTILHTGDAIFDNASLPTLAANQSGLGASDFNNSSMMWTKDEDGSFGPVAKGGVLHSSNAASGNAAGYDVGVTTNALRNITLPAMFLAYHEDTLCFEASGLFGATANLKRLELLFRDKSSNMVSIVSVPTNAFNNTAWQLTGKVTRQSDTTAWLEGEIKTTDPLALNTVAFKADGAWAGNFDSEHSYLWLNAGGTNLNDVVVVRSHLWYWPAKRAGGL